MKQTKRRYSMKKKYKTQHIDIESALIHNIIDIIEPNLTDNIYHNLKLIQNLPGILPDFKILIFQEYLINSKRRLTVGGFVDFIFQLVSKCCENNKFLLEGLKSIFQIIPESTKNKIINIQSKSGVFEWDSGVFSIENQNNSGFLHIIIESQYQCIYKFDIVKILVDEGIDVYKKNRNGLTALQLLESLPYESDPRIQILLRHAMNMDVSENLFHNLQKRYNIQHTQKQNIDMKDLKPVKKKKKKFKMDSKSKNISIYQEHKNLIEIFSKNNLEKEISKGNCVLIFYMRTCPYCIKLREVIFKLCENDKKVVIMEKDKLDEDIKSTYNIDGYPTIYIIKPDGSRELFDGKRDYESLSQNLSSN